MLEYIRHNPITAIVQLLAAIALSFSIANAAGAHGHRWAGVQQHNAGTHQVEVINAAPLQVEVINQAIAPEPTGEAPAPVAQQVFQFVGVSTETITGDAGGIFGLSDVCAAEFGQAKICTELEALSTIAPPDFVGHVWIDSTTSTSYCGTMSDPWTDDGSSLRGSTIMPTGKASSMMCDTPQPVACCGWAPLN